MAVRPTRPRGGKNCLNCNDKKPKSAQIKNEPLMNVTDAQGARLWHHICFGTGTCISMIEGYTVSALPQVPLDDVRALRDRLIHVVHRLEAQRHV